MEGSACYVLVSCRGMTSFLPRMFHAGWLPRPHFFQHQLSSFGANPHLNGGVRMLYGRVLWKALVCNKFVYKDHHFGQTYRGDLFRGLVRGFRAPEREGAPESVRFHEFGLQKKSFWANLWGETLSEALSGASTFQNERVLQKDLLKKQLLLTKSTVWGQLIVSPRLHSSSTQASKQLHSRSTAAAQLYKDTHCTFIHNLLGVSVQPFVGRWARGCSRSSVFPGCGVLTT